MQAKGEGLTPKRLNISIFYQMEKKSLATGVDLTSRHKLTISLLDPATP